MSNFNEADFISEVNGVIKEDSIGEVHEAIRPKTQEELKAEVAKLVNNSPSRQRARYNPDFTLTDEYKGMVARGESTLAYQMNGSYTDEKRQAEIDNSLAIPLSESIKIRDNLLAEIEKLEAEMDNFPEDKAQARVDEITAEYKEKTKGLSRSARAHLQDDYNKACDEAILALYTKPRNDLAVKRYEAIERYKVYENRIKLYVATNRGAIQQRIDEARAREIDQNLLALAEYMEG